MRHLALASLAVLALAGCSSYDNDRAAAPAAVTSGSATSGPVTRSNPIDSAGRSDAATAGSASNTASGSTVTQRAAPRTVP